MSKTSIFRNWFPEEKVIKCFCPHFSKVFFWLEWWARVFCLILFWKSCCLLWASELIFFSVYYLSPYSPLFKPWKFLCIEPSLRFQVACIVHKAELTGDLGRKRVLEQWEAAGRGGRAAEQGAWEGAVFPVTPRTRCFLSELLWL